MIIFLVELHEKSVHSYQKINAFEDIFQWFSLDFE